MGSELIPPSLTYIADNITSSQNILGISREQSAKWAKDLNLPKRAETIFFAGCGYQLSSHLEAFMSLLRQMDRSAIGAELPVRFARFQKKLGFNLSGVYGNVLAKSGDSKVPPLEAAIKVLRNLGIQPGYLADDEPCCGAPLYHAGLHGKYAENANQAYQKLKSFGVRQIIGIVPSCTYAIQRLFPLYVEDYDLEVKHFLEVVAGEVSSLELRFPRQVKVTYHDPCQLARYLKLIEEPRRILRSIKGIELVETEWTKGE